MSRTDSKVRRRHTRDPSRDRFLAVVCRNPPDRALFPDPGGLTDRRPADHRPVDLHGPARRRAGSDPGLFRAHAGPRRHGAGPDAGPGDAGRGLVVDGGSGSVVTGLRYRLPWLSAARSESASALARAFSPDRPRSAGARSG